MVTGQNLVNPEILDITLYYLEEVKVTDFKYDTQLKITTLEKNTLGIDMHSLIYKCDHTIIKNQQT